MRKVALYSMIFFMCLLFCSIIDTVSGKSVIDNLGRNLIITIGILIVSILEDYTILVKSIHTRILLDLITCIIVITGIFAGLEFVDKGFVSSLHPLSVGFVTLSNMILKSLRGQYSTKR